MGIKNCGHLDLSRISAEDLLTNIVWGAGNPPTATGSAYVRTEVDENLVVILPGRTGLAPAGVYAIVKFNEGCFVDMCGNIASVQKAFAQLSNTLVTMLGQGPNGQKPASIPANDQKPPDAADRDPPTHTGSSSSTEYTSPQTICGGQLPGLLEAQHAVDFNAISQLGFQPAALYPDKFHIPMKSNIGRYGSWSTTNFDNVAGGAEIVVNADLAPWNFGTINAMNQAGNALVDNLATGLKKAETGTITRPGLPTIANLGAAIANGPYLTSMNVSFGSSGINTTYEFRTFNPKAGGITRMSIDRFKELTEARREQLRLFKANTINQNRINQALNRVRATRLIEDRNRRIADQGTLQRILVGEIYSFSMTPNDQDPGQRSVVGLTTLAKSVGEMTYDFEKKAYMSLDGLFGPVSKNGDGSLPRFYRYQDTNVTNGIPSTHKSSPILPHPPFLVDKCISPAPSFLNYTVYSMDLSQPYFDPLTNKFDVNQHYHDGAGAGHVIDLVGRLSSVPGGGNVEDEDSDDGMIMNFLANSNTNKYTNDYRFLGLRGPLVLHSWGYDLDGKPIPNETDSDANTESGIFTSQGLKDRFLKDWLKKPASWPVAPVDLRFDRKRGLWVSPQPYKIMVAKIIQEVPAFGRGLGTLVHHDQENPRYDKDGNVINDTLSGYCENGTVRDCSENWIDVITHACLTAAGLILEKKKIKVADISENDCCELIIPVTGCGSSTTSSESDNSCSTCFTVDCSSTSSLSSSSVSSTSDDMNLILIEDRIGHRHRIGCYVYVYYDTSSSSYIVLQH